MFVSVTVLTLLGLSYARIPLLAEQHVTVLLLISAFLASIFTLVYSLILYPTFLDPLRHLPAPKVSSHTILRTGSNRLRAVSRSLVMGLNRLVDLHPSNLANGCEIYQTMAFCAFHQSEERMP